MCLLQYENRVFFSGLFSELDWQVYVIEGNKRELGGGLRGDLGLSGNVKNTCLCFSLNHEGGKKAV